MSASILNVDVGTTVKVLTKNIIQFMCHVKSDDDVVVNWFKNGKKIANRHGYFVIVKDMLTIRDTSKEGVFTISCVVSRPQIQTKTARISSVVKIVGEVFYYYYYLFLDVCKLNVKPPCIFSK